jgi:prepilin-type N-terminal cleavage/methylation domain-containing protein
MKTMRHVWGMRGEGTSRHGARGFSLVELLVTVLLAGIIFLAMVPLFVQVLKRTSTDTRRVVATNVAQARIEAIRLLAASLGPTPGSTTQPIGYSAITAANLNSSTYASGLFATSFPAAHGGVPYQVVTTVSPSNNPTPAAKTITVTVSRPGVDSFATTVTTVIKDPTAITSTSTSGPVDPNAPHSLTVSFKNWTEVKGVKVVYVNTSPTPNVTTTAAPNPMVPSSSSTTCVWTNLPGGLNYLYTVTCTPQAPSSWTTPLVGESVHLISNGFMKFDTNPGGS